MSYTRLLHSPRGVPLWRHHVQRLGLSAQEERSLQAQLSRLPHQSYGIFKTAADLLEIKPKGPSALFDGMPTRTLPTPLPALSGMISKPASPCVYDAVRSPGFLTLLSNPSGSELCEACSAALLASDGKRMWLASAASPQVASCFAAALRESLGLSQEPIPRSGISLLAINAVAGTIAPTWPGPAFPAQLREQADEVFWASAVVLAPAA